MKKLSRREKTIVREFVKLLRRHSALEPTKLAHLVDVAYRAWADLQFIVESQKLAGLPGRISTSVLDYEPDLKRITRSAKKFGAQVPHIRHEAKRIKREPL